MVVQHNLTAMNSNRMLGITTKSQAKATEKLSSGYKINRAADDAAGLSISEKMRKQIRGLSQASMNAQDGISSVQTAEGALTEVHDMLQRMNELAVKAANGTNSADDRQYIQAEVDQLITEIDRVSTTTKFNETYLLKGDHGDGTGTLSYESATKAVDPSAAAGDDLFAADNGTYKKVGEGDKTNGDMADTGITEATGTGTAASTFKTASIIVGGVTYNLVSDFVVGNDASGTKYSTTLDDIVKGLNNTSGTATNKYVGSLKDLERAIKEASKGEFKEVALDADANGKLTAELIAFADLNKGLDVSLHVGADSTKDNKIGLTIEMMSARGLGVNGLLVNGATDDNATNSIDTIKAAIQKVSEQRSALGAAQNRLEHTIANLDNIVENTTSAEAAIRDTDMAKQMVEYSNNNILAQAGQAMLAQANQSNQGVLSLLQ
ncbi:flagellin [Lachnospiraceae bacterium YSD2013]|nr:flagellin [Lachnospiraceae bacterium YSD2013]